MIQIIDTNSTKSLQQTAIFINDTKYLSLNYYDNLELFNMLNKKVQLCFTLINDFYYTTFKIKTIINLPNFASYHIYVNTYYNEGPYTHNFINLKYLHAAIPEKKDLSNLNLTILKIFGRLNNTIEHMTNLKILSYYDFYESCSGMRIKNPNLISLTTDTKYTEDIACMTNLKKLKYIGHNISQENLNNLNLVSLFIERMNGNCNINHMSNLKSLTTNIVKIEHIIGPNLVKLKLLGWDPKDLNINNLTESDSLINFNINNLTELKSLMCWNYFIEDKDIENLNLVKLKVHRDISKTNHMTKLKILELGGDYDIDENIHNLNLIVFGSYSSNISNINNMTKLKKLNCNSCNGITDENIKNLNLIILDASNNPNISDISHMTKLKKLDCTGISGITDESIKNLNLYYIYSKGNEKITIK